MTCDHLSSQASESVPSGGSGAEPPRSWRNTDATQNTSNPDATHNPASPWHLGDVYLHLETCEQLIHAGHVLTALTELRAAKREIERELEPTREGTHVQLAKAACNVMLERAKRDAAQAAKLRLVLMPQHTARELRAMNRPACARFVRWLADRLEVLA